MEDAEQRLAQLTAEMAWLRRLARALLRSDDAADLAHDTWLAARDHVPTDGRPLRPWLSRVARNLAISKARARQRREAREQASGSLVEAGSRPDELVQRVELQKLVATEVLGLAEPYRSTVLLHFFDELTCAEIARRLKLPEGTVRRRLKVGLDELRARLNTKTETSGAGLAALAALAGAAAPRPSVATAVGVVAMKKLVTAVLVMLALLVSAVIWHRRASIPHEPPLAPRPASAVETRSQRRHEPRAKPSTGHLGPADGPARGPLADAEHRRPMTGSGRL